jgi:hypothetical protein
MPGTPDAIAMSSAKDSREFVRRPAEA